MQSGPPSLAPEEQQSSSSQRNKRRETSEPSAASSSVEEPDTAVAMSPAQRTPNMRHSSRESTPPDGMESVRYTRTGRVSRANKGQRVHHCEECGNTYTRAEHLRRHQQNHKPGAFPCDIPGCSRSFYREDLLIRHKMRHNESSSAESAQPSPSSQAPGPAVETSTQRLLPVLSNERPMVGNTGVPEVLPLPQRRIDGTSAPQGNDAATLRKAPPVAHRQHRLLVPSMGSYDDGAESSGYNSDASSSICSQPVYMAPLPCEVNPTPYYPPHGHRSRLPSDAQFMDYYPSVSTSYSASSGALSVQYPLAWDTTQSIGLAPTYFDTFPISHEAYSDGEIACDASMTDPQLLFQCRDLEEQTELTVPLPSLEVVSFNLCLDDPMNTTEMQYLRSYWTKVHPHFPIVHRTSFEQINTSPLLKAAVLALAANAEDGAPAKNYARTLHERCIKILHKRTINRQHSWEICDMQAILLIEIFSIFKSRRPPLQLSKHFETVAEILAHTDDIYEEIQSPSRHSHGIPTNVFYDIDTFARPDELESKQRLLIACYIVDRQHALLFGRSRITCFANNTVQLPSPRAGVSWDGDEEQQAFEQHFLDSGWPTPPEDGFSLSTADHTPDTFQAMFSLSLSTDLDLRVTAGNNSPFDVTDHHSPRAQLAYHTLMMCENTPVRDLLAVAGESWVMSDKLATRAEHTAAQLTARDWAAGSRSLSRADSPAQIAVAHALRILEMHQGNARTDLLVHEWSLYLASLVIWARAYVETPKAGKKKQRQVSPSASSSAQATAEELEISISAIISGGATAVIDLDRAERLLQWTKNRIAAVDLLHHCGLTNGALDVLGRLVARGKESGWFG